MQSGEPEYYDYSRLLRRQKKGSRNIECDESLQDVPIQEILDGVYEAAAATDKTIKDLVRLNKLEEALKVFESTHPEEAILLHQKYQEGQSYYLLGLGTGEAWSVTQRQIGKSLLVLSKRKSTLATTQAKSNIQQQLDAIQQSIIQGFADTKESLGIIQELSQNNTADILDWLEVAFKIRQVQELENFAELEQTFLTAKQSSNWEAKLKLAVPLIHHLGVKIETETKFDLKKYISQIKDKTVALSLKYGIAV